MSTNNRPCAAGMSASPLAPSSPPGHHDTSVTIASSEFDSIAINWELLDPCRSVNYINLLSSECFNVFARHIMENSLLPQLLRSAYIEKRLPNDDKSLTMYFLAVLNVAVRNHASKVIDASWGLHSFVVNLTSLHEHHFFLHLLLQLPSSVICRLFVPDNVAHWVSLLLRRKMSWELVYALRSAAVIVNCRLETDDIPLIVCWGRALGTLKKCASNWNARDLTPRLRLTHAAALLDLLSALGPPPDSSLGSSALSLSCSMFSRAVQFEAVKYEQAHLACAIANLAAIVPVDQVPMVPTLQTITDAMLNLPCDDAPRLNLLVTFSVLHQHADPTTAFVLSNDSSARKHVAACRRQLATKSNPLVEPCLLMAAFLAMLNPTYKSSLLLAAPTTAAELVFQAALSKRSWVQCLSIITWMRVALQKSRAKPLLGKLQKAASIKRRSGSFLTGAPSRKAMLLFNCEQPTAYLINYTRILNSIAALMS